MAVDEHGFDDGLEAAPGAGLPRLPRGETIEDWARSANNRAAWAAEDVAAGFAPIESGHPAIQEARILADSLKPPKPIDPSRPIGTFNELLEDLVLKRNVPFGEAVSIIEDLYNEGDPYVKSLYEIDEIMSRMPNRAERALRGFGAGVAKPLAAMSDVAAGLFGKPQQEIDENPLSYKSAKRLEEEIPASTLKTIGGAVGGILPAIGTGAPAGALVASQLLRLPRYAEAAKAIGTVATQGSLGKAITSSILGPTALTQAKNAIFWGDALGFAAANVGFGAAEGGTPGELAAGLALDMAMAGAAKYVFVPTVEKLFGTKGYDDAIRWVAAKSGLKPAELTSRIKTFDAFAELLTQTEAPPGVWHSFFNAKAGGLEWNRAIGTQIGAWGALRKLTPERMESIIKILPSQAQKSAKGVYYKATKNLLEQEANMANAARRAAGVGAKNFAKALSDVGEGLAGKDLTRTIKISVNPIPVESAGARTYFNPRNPQYRTTTGLGGGDKPKTFVNPKVFNYDPKTETYAEAFLKQTQPKQGKVALYVLNKYAHRTTENYNNLAKEFAYRVAKRMGFDSLAARAPNAADDIYVDLLGYKPQESLEQIVSKIEADIHRNWSSKFENYPLIAPLALAGGVGLTTLLAPKEVEAIDWSKIRALLPQLGTAFGKPRSVELMLELDQLTTPQSKGILMALQRLDSLRPFDGIDYDDAETALGLLHKIHETVQLTPERLKFEFSGFHPTTGLPLNPTDLGKATRVHVRVTHPDVISDKTQAPAAIGDIRGHIYNEPQGRVLSDLVIDSYGPDLLGPKKVRDVLRDIKKKYNVRFIDDGTRQTGTAGVYGKRRSKINLTKLTGIPLAIGAASFFTPQEAEAKLIDVKSLSKIATRLSDSLVDKTVNPLWDFIDTVYESYPATGKVLMGIAERMGLEGTVSKTTLLRNYAKVKADLQMKPLDIVDEDVFYRTPRESLQRQVAIPVENEGHLAFDIEHPLSTEGTLARIGGYIDPLTKEWVLDVVGAKRAGIGLAAIGSMVDYAKSVGKISGVKGKLSKLGVLAIATAAASSYDFLFPQDAGAAPIGKWFSKGLRGITDDTVAAMAKSNSADELLESINAIRAAAKESVDKKAAESVGERLFNFGLVDANEAFDPEMSKLFASDPQLKVGAYMFRLPIDAIEDPGADIFLTRMVDLEGKLISNKNSVMRNSLELVDNVLDEAAVKIDDFDEFHTAITGLKRTGTGELVQTANVRPHLDKAARVIREEIYDNLFQAVTGIDAKAPAILVELGLEETPETWKMLRWLQNQDLTIRNLKWGGRTVKNSEMLAAERTRGMINPKPWQTLDTKFIDGYMTIMPISGEKARLLDEVQRLKELYPNGVPEDLKGYVKTIRDRLAQLADIERKVATRKAVPTNILAKQHYYGPISEAIQADIPELVRERDPKKILHSYIKGLYAKLFFDEQLYFARGLATMYESVGGVNGPQSAAWIRELMNVLRGIRSVNEDSRVAAIVQYTLNKLGRTKTDPITVQKVRDFGSKAMMFQYITKLGLSVRYPITNMSQTMLTTAPIAGWGNTIAATAKVAGNLKAAYKEALEAGVVKGESLFAREIDPTGTFGVAKEVGGRLAAAADFLPAQSETLNRVIAFHAGKLQALNQLAKGKFKVPKYIRYFDHTVLQSGDVEKIATEYAKAFTLTTQFVYGPLGRPTFFSGGVIRRVAGQFKSFTASYGTLLKDTINHARETGDVLPFLNMSTALVLLGGAPALLFGAEGISGNLIDAARNQLVKLGLPPDIIPRYSIFGKAAEIMGVNIGLDIGGSLTPTTGIPDPFSNPGRFATWSLGPTFGGAIEAGQALHKYGAGQTGGSETFNKVTQQVLPIAVSGIEALQEAGIGREFFDKFNYRGGIYSDTGRRLVENRPTSEIVFRGLGLQPSVRTQRRRYLRDIENALENEDYNRAYATIEAARAAGFIIDKRTLGSVQGRIARRKSRKESPNQ